MDEKWDIIELLKQNKVIQINPQGKSMLPLLVEGRDAVILRSVEQKDIRRGQVLLYRGQYGVLTLHRVWKVGNDGVFFVGDSQVEVEGPVRFDYIYGTMCGYVRKGKEHSTNEVMYRLIYGIWLFLRPVRAWIVASVSRLKGKK